VRLFDIPMGAAEAALVVQEEELRVRYGRGLWEMVDDHLAGAPPAMSKEILAPGACGNLKVGVVSIFPESLTCAVRPLLQRK